MTVNFSSASNIVSPHKPQFPTNPWIVASDGPETGGITGTLGEFDKPLPGACEERPKMTVPVTGEEIYISEWLKEQPGICYMA